MRVAGEERVVGRQRHLLERLAQALVARRAVRVAVRVEHLAQLDAQA